MCIPRRCIVVGEAGDGGTPKFLGGIKDVAPCYGQVLSCINDRISFVTLGRGALAPPPRGEELNGPLGPEATLFQPLNRLSIFG